MRTLGIDLASKTEKTALCEIDWNNGAATVSTVQVDASDDDILQRAQNLTLAKPHDLTGDAIGIDAPFGWPQPFVELVSRPPTAIGGMQAWDAGRARSLCYRLTDDHVRTVLKIVPLTVSADKIAYSAMRCAGLLDKLRVVDRSGVDGMFEVYPAAALKAWGFPHRGYKSSRSNDPVAKAILAALFNQVREACHPWLRFAGGTVAEQLCSTNDDAFDALIASFAARAARLGLIRRPVTQEEIARAKVEGWIAIPAEDVLIGGLV